MGEYLQLRDIISYRLSVELSNDAWEIYTVFDWHIKKIIGDQWIRSVDSIGANIAEGYGRYHYLDRIKFYYNARGSAFEAKHWVLLLSRRKKLTQEQYEIFLHQLDEIHKQINIFIKSSRSQKEL